MVPRLVAVALLLPFAAGAVLTLAWWACGTPDLDEGDDQ